MATTDLGVKGTLRELYKQATFWVDNVKISFKEWRAVWVINSDVTGKPHPGMDTSGRVPVSIDAMGSGVLVQTKGGEPEIANLAGDATVTIDSTIIAGHIYSAIYIEGTAGSPAVSLQADVAGDDNQIGETVTAVTAKGTSLLVNQGMALIQAGKTLGVKGGLSTDVWTYAYQKDGI